MSITSITHVVQSVEYIISIFRVHSKCFVWCFLIHYWTPSSQNYVSCPSYPTNSSVFIFSFECRRFMVSNSFPIIFQNIIFKQFIVISKAKHGIHFESASLRVLLKRSIRLWFLFYGYSSYLLRNCSCLLQRTLPSWYVRSYILLRFYSLLY